MRSLRTILVGFLAVIAAIACSPVSRPPGPLHARIARLAARVGKALGAPFGPLPAVDVVAGLGPSTKLPAEDSFCFPFWMQIPAFSFLGWPKSGTGVLPIPGSDRLLVVVQPVFRVGEFRRELAESVAGLWLERRLGGAGYCETEDGPARWAREKALSAMAAEVKDRLRKAGIFPAPRAKKPTPFAPERRDLVCFFSERNQRVLRAGESVRRRVLRRLRAALVGRWGLCGAIAEIRRRPPSTFREILHPEEYIRGKPEPDPLSDLVQKTAVPLRGGLLPVKIRVLTSRQTAALMGRPEAPPHLVGGAEVTYGYAAPHLATYSLLAKTRRAASAFYSALVAEERRGNATGSFLSFHERTVTVRGGRGTDFGERALNDTFSTGGMSRRQETAVLLRGKLVLLLRLDDPSRFYTDGVGVGLELLSLALNVPSPGPRAWVQRWCRFARASRYVEALRDPDPRVRRRAAARWRAMEDPIRTPWRSFRGLFDDSDPQVRAEGLSVLLSRWRDSRVRKDRAVLAIEADGLLDLDLGVRLTAARLLLRLPPRWWDSEFLLSAELRVIRDPSPRFRRIVLDAVMRHSFLTPLPPERVRPLLGFLRDPDASTRWVVARTFGNAAKVTRSLSAALAKAAASDPDAKVRKAARSSLRKLGIR